MILFICSWIRTLKSPPHMYIFQDIAALSMSDPKILNRLRVMPVIVLDAEKPGRYVMSVSDLLKNVQKVWEVSNCQIYFWLRPVLVYMLTVVTVSGISAVSAYARQNILQNNHV